MNNIDSQTDRLVRPTEAARLLGTSRSTLWRLESQGRLPKRVHISERISGWFLSELIVFINKNRGAVMDATDNRKEM